MHPAKLALATAAAALIAAPAFAQKSKDTLRLAINDPFVVLSGYYVPVDEAGNFYRRVYGTLIANDERNKTFVPNLAKSWTRVSPTVLEFELRDDVTFHNGNKFDADDVVSTLQFTSDPKQAFRFKSRYTWVKTVEKLGPYKVRIESKEPDSLDLGLLAYRTYIQDKESFDSLENPGDYGRLTPYGTGPYKVVSIDRNDGILVERFDDFKGDPKHFRAPIKRIHGVPVPDRQTQVAELLTGGVDMLRNVQPDTAKELAKNPDIDVTTLPTASFIYIVVDAAGRSNMKAFTDHRVRKALWMAIDRQSLIDNIIPGGKEAALKMDAICFEHILGCKTDVKPPEYDPEMARKLLAEAGYADGFELTYDVFAPIKTIGEAIAGQLREVGIRAAVNPVTINVFRKKQSAGEINMVSVFYPTAGHPAAGNILDVFFEGPRDYNRDPDMHALMKAGRLEFDEAKQAEIYRKAFTLNNERNYVMAVASLPTVYAHSKDVKVERNLLSAGDSYIDDYMWK